MCKYSSKKHICLHIWTICKWPSNPWLPLSLHQDVNVVQMWHLPSLLRIANLMQYQSLLLRKIVQMWYLLHICCNLATLVNPFFRPVIHPSQNAFVKGRSIFNAITTIDDIVDYTKRNSWSGFMIAIDFEKAFDTLDFQFLIRTLHKFNFGPSIIQWVRVLYKNWNKLCNEQWINDWSFSTR